MVGNSFKPFFFGRFEVRADGVYLTGRFSMLGLVKAFMTLWLGGVLAIGIASGVPEFNAAGRNWPPVLGGLGMFAAGILLAGESRKHVHRPLFVLAPSPGDWRLRVRDARIGVRSLSAQTMGVAVGLGFIQRRRPRLDLPSVHSFSIRRQCGC
jgi:hypothetical protein